MKYPIDVQDQLGNTIAVIDGTQIRDCDGDVVARVNTHGDGYRVESALHAHRGFVGSDNIVREVTGFSSREEAYDEGVVVGGIRQAAATFPVAAADDVPDSLLLALLFVTKRITDLLAKEKAHAAVKDLPELSTKARSELSRLLDSSVNVDTYRSSNPPSPRSPVGVVHQRGMRASPTRSSTPAVHRQPMQTKTLGSKTSRTPRGPVAVTSRTSRRR